MSIHIEAKPGEIAERILLPGDPLRAKYIAETYLDEVTQYNNVRGMLGFTGTYKGEPVSVQGTGMGIPSISIYVNELIRNYGVKKLIRVGTCGGVQNGIHVRDVILAMSATTDSSINHGVFPNIDYAPTADFELLHKAYSIGTKLGLSLRTGNILSADVFYRDSMEVVKKLGEYGVLAVEMETSALYTLAAKYGVQALTVLTVSDHIFSDEPDTTAAERQTTFNDMINIALETAISN
ncbi:purine-nucleoside phosphorylase [Sporolactobacillus shoreicorticis]|uniref:Purine nucleoside phosphorylase DeoD-type n=1 Tax=Sporolactobacillus shoreicorticis TaxID=1923877 RepID=A0ABW5RZS5_9BACL|nr:purine-nucleoside phosphorylase [Sporolactobacillus shoreicorticis]MCO7126777.1 purine-nucleoside phosphorylase [Sporolactobacillus shoreicorticis]